MNSANPVVHFQAKYRILSGIFLLGQFGLFGYMCYQYSAPIGCWKKSSQDLPVQICSWFLICCWAFCGDGRGVAEAIFQGRESDCTLFLNPSVVGNERTHVYSKQEIVVCPVKL